MFFCSFKCHLLSIHLLLMTIILFSIHSASRFPFERKLDKHMLTHREALCHACGKTFKSKYALKKHTVKYHMTDKRLEKEPQQCTICHKWLLGLKEHMKNIHDSTGNEHRCKICNHVSTTAKGLRGHVIFRHKSERKHQCSVCNKAFKRPLALRVSH